MHALLSTEGSEAFLMEELRRTFPEASLEHRASDLILGDFQLCPETPPILVFARQLLPDFQERHAPSIAAWSELLVAAVMAKLPENQPWQLQINPHYGSGNAGQQRCHLIREVFLEQIKRRRRHLFKAMEHEPGPFTPLTSFVQLLLNAPDRGLISVAPAPIPHQFRSTISPFPKGEVPVASDKSAPSRAFAKLVEAEWRLGVSIGNSDLCVDLGASPGSWSYVAIQRGARVTAVDRAPLRPDLMRHPQLAFRKGNAFNFQPEAPVDWVLCDVIAAPARSIELLLDWVRHRRCRRFVVTIKFKGQGDYAQLERLKRTLPSLCDEFFLTRLCANKNEACAFGIVALEAQG